MFDFLTTFCADYGKVEVLDAGGVYRIRLDSHDKALEIVNALIKEHRFHLATGFKGVIRVCYGGYELWVEYPRLF